MSCEDKGCGCRKAFEHIEGVNYSDWIMFSAGWHSRDDVELSSYNKKTEYWAEICELKEQLVEKDKEIAYLRRQWQREMKAQEEGAK